MAQRVSFVGELGWELYVGLGYSNGRLVPPPSKVFSTIMELARSEAMLFKFGSGTGTDLSTLRSSREKLAGGGKPSGGDKVFVAEFGLDERNVVLSAAKSRATIQEVPAIVTVLMSRSNSTVENFFIIATPFNLVGIYKLFDYFANSCGRP